MKQFGMTTKKLSGRILAGFLCIVLLFTLVPAIPAQAAEEDEIGSMFLVPAGDPSEFGYLDTMVVDENGNEVERTVALTESDKDTAVTLPSSYRSPYVTSVKNQQGSGSCWAFGAISMAETSMIRTGQATNPNYSESHLAWFGNKSLVTDPNDPTYGDGQPDTDTPFDDGGNVYISGSALARGSGIEEEVYAPFGEGRTGYASVTYNNEERYISTAQVTEVQVIDPENTAAIKEAIMEYGGAGISYYASGYSSAYQGTGETSCYCQKTETGSNHAVYVVGWDDNFSRSNFASRTTGDGVRTVVPSSNGAWLVKNSWGTDFGDDGYFWLSYEDTSISSIYTMDFVDRTESGNTYQHDGSWYVMGWYYSASNALETANVFTAEEDENLTRVGFYCASMGADITVNVYKLGSSDTVTGTRVATETLSVDHEGYYTIELDDPIPLTEGQRFSVAVKVESDTDYSTAAYENNYYYNGHYYNYAESTSGESYYRSWSSSSSASSWQDHGAEGEGNFIIKAFTETDEDNSSYLDSLVTIAKNNGVTSSNSPAYANAVSLLNASDPDGADIDNAIRRLKGILADKGISLAEIVSTAGAGGTITPAGGRYYVKGSNVTFTITPNSNYKVASLVVDGVTKTAATSYTFSNVSGTHTISATFTQVNPNVPKAPVLSAAAGDKLVTLSWTAPANGGSSILGYKVTCSNGQTATLAASATSYTFTNLTNNRQYTFSVLAYNANGDGEAATIQATPKGAVPAAPQVQATAGSKQVALTWTAPANNGSAITGYKLTCSNGQTVSLGATATSYTFTGLTNGQEYTFTVLAKNENGDGAAATVRATPQGAVPGQPVLTATPDDEAVVLSWSVPNTNGCTITGYEVTCSNGQSVTLGAAAASYTFIGLTNGVTYTFTVRAMSEDGVSPAATAEATPSGTPFASGTGTETDPYIITTAKHLQSFSALVANGYHDICGKLGANIDMTGVVFKPIGSTKDYAFAGEFDGAGYTIKNLTLTNANTTAHEFGLFGLAVSATISNVKLTGLKITLTEQQKNTYAGGIVAQALQDVTVENCSVNGKISVTKCAVNVYVGGIAGTAGTYNSGGSDVKIENCKASGSVTASAYYTACAGGIVGNADSAVISKCASNATVTGTDYSGANGSSANIGGIAGSIYNTTVEDSLNEGAVKATSSYKQLSNVDAGGVVGYLDYSTVERCYNTGGVTATNTSNTYFSMHLGGIAGMNAGETALIDSCYNMGAVKNENTSTSAECGLSTGGITGFSSGTIRNCYNTATVTTKSASRNCMEASSGGIVSSAIGVIENCHNRGVIAATKTGGGATYYAISGSGVIENCYYLADTGTGIAGATKLTSAQYKKAANFSGFDFTSTWRMGSSMPMLQGLWQFKDASYFAWYYPYVKYAVDNGLFNGTSDTTFEPDTVMTRAMLVMVLYNKEGRPTPAGGNSFTDVPEGTWYRDAVVWAAENGIVSGTAPGVFNPTGKLTREQLASMLMRYSQYKGYDTDTRGDLGQFSDGAKVSGWAKNAFQWAVGEGLISGSAGKCMPQGNATRSQVSTVLYFYETDFEK